MEPHLQRYLDWYATRDLKDKVPSETSKKLMDRLQQLIDSKEGRIKIALAMVQASQKRIEKIRVGRSSQREVKRFVTELENFIGVLTEEERFSPAIMAMRKQLFELCDILTGRYGVQANQEEYEGPRPTRFERLLGVDDEDLSLDDPESDEPIIQAIM
jgi:hypothetical protein